MRERRSQWGKKIRRSFTKQRGISLTEAVEKRATIRNPTEGELLQLQQEVFATGKPTESNRKFTIAVVCVLLYITTSANF